MKLIFLLTLLAQEGRSPRTNKPDVKKAPIELVIEDICLDKPSELPQELFSDIKVSGSRKRYAPTSYSPKSYTPKSYSPKGYVPRSYAPKSYSPKSYTPKSYSPYTPKSYTPKSYSPKSYTLKAYSPKSS